MWIGDTIDFLIPGFAHLFMGFPLSYYSLTQMKDPKKGLSFNSMTDLNMQLGLNNYSAADAINKLDAKELEKIFKYFGDEKDSKRIAYKIIKERKNKILNTQDLVKIIDNSKRKKNFKINS